MKSLIEKTDGVLEASMQIDYYADGGINFARKGKFSFDISVGMLMTALLSVSRGMVDDIAKETGEDKRDDIKKDFYDFLNANFTAFLTEFAPELEKNKDLTAEALLEIENKILDKQPAQIDGQTKLDA